MDATRWKRVAAICGAALDQQGDGRSRFIAEACGGDSALRDEVEALLARDTRAGTFLEPPSSLSAADVLEQSRDGELLNCRLGAYTIRRVLGRGGMGVVYEAEQDSPRRTVALKVMRPLPYADALTPRLFRREGRALARLEHPGIAVIHEAGSNDGCYYFAMERVAGVPLTQYAHDRALSIRERLKLCTRVCEAIHYAHQRGVIHRDLKPSNILVTADGQPKVLDFGLARIIDPPADCTRITESGAFHGTLAYASPEQTCASGDDIDIRSDVYSLGVILYELLTGRLPFDLRNVALPAAARMICEQAPAADAAVRGELSSIVLKALQKDRERRYCSAAELAEDIERYLNHRPILARPPSAVYQFRKFVGRNRVASTVVGTLLIGLVTLAAVSTWLAQRYADQRDVATHAAAEERVARRSADEVVKFLESLLSRGNPFVADAQESTLTDIVAQAESRLAELDGEPLVQARVLTALGDVYVALAKYDRANELFDRAIAIRTARLGDEHPDVAAALAGKGSAKSAAGEHSQAIETASRALAMVKKARGGEHLETAAALTSLGTVQYNARVFDAAIASFKEALAIRSRLLGDSHLDVADSLANLGSAYRDGGRILEAVPLLRRCLEIRENRSGDSPAVVDALQNLAHATFAADREETRRLVERQVAVARRVYHAKHPVVANALSDLAFMLFGTDASAACDLYNEALAIRRDSLGSDHPLVAESLNDLGNLLGNRGDLAGAERCHLEALEIRTKHFGSRDIRVAHSLNSLSVTNQRLGKVSEAAELAERVLDIWREIYGPADAMVGVAHQNVGAFYADLRDWDRAEVHLRAAAEIFSKLEHGNLWGPLQLLGTMNLSRGRFDIAEIQLRRALEVVQAAQAPEPLQLAHVLHSLGVVLNLLDCPGEAREMLEESLRCYRQALAPGDAAVFLPLVNLSEVLLRSDPQAAEGVINEALALEPKLSPDDPVHGDLLAARGLLGLVSDRPDEALAPLHDALLIHERKWGAGHWISERTRARYGACLARLEQWPDADAALAVSLPVLESTFGELHPETRSAADAWIRVRAPPAKPRREPKPTRTAGDARSVRRSSRTTTGRS